MRIKKDNNRRGRSLTLPTQHAQRKNQTRPDEETTENQRGNRKGQGAKETHKHPGTRKMVQVDRQEKTGQQRSKHSQDVLDNAILPTLKG